MRSSILAYSTLALTLAATLATGACTAEVVAGPGPARPGEGHAMRDGFSYLGERFVNNGNDHDVIQVGRRDGRFHEIMLVVENAPVDMYNVVVVFGDGQRFDPGTRMRFEPGTTSRRIGLPGGERVISRVDFHYGSMVGSGAKVELWGR